MVRGAASASFVSGDGVDGGLNCWQRASAALRREATDFCLLTGLHGYKYIVQPGKHQVERLFWGTLVLVSMVAAVYMMLIAYQFNRNHPTLLAVDSTHYPLWNTEAPGVTVCPSNKVVRSKALQAARNMSLPQNMTAEQLVEEMGLLVELVFPRTLDNSKLRNLQSILDHNLISADRLMEMVSPTCDELLVRCMWKRRLCLKCSDIFRSVRTAFGFCCSFNYMDRDHKFHKPRMGGCVGVSYDKVQRLSACGYTNGLSAVTVINPKEYVSSLLGSFASMVFIHSPWSYPDANADMKVVSAGTVTFISYLTKVTEASPRLRSMLPPDTRRCLFWDETYLPMYQNYTYFNCKASCRGNTTLRECGCIPSTYPYVLNRTLCNLLDVPCMTALHLPPPGARSPIQNDSHCQPCHPLCTNIEFQVETSIGTLNWNNIPDGDLLMQGLSGPNEDIYGVFHVFPNDLVTTKYKLDLYMTDEELLGSLGGLSGLFVGFSLVSGFEFLYFFTVRPLFRMWGVRNASRGEVSSSDTPRSVPPTVEPFPLAAPSVFRFRRRGFHDPTSTGSQKRDWQQRNNARPGIKGRLSVIPIIE